MVLGSDVSSVLAWVLATLGIVRPWRAPIFEALPDVAAGDLHIIVVDVVRRRRLSERVLARVALALRAVENYYRAIGATWDARRMSDMRWPVDELLAEFTRGHEVAADNRRADMWARAFANALWRHSSPVSSDPGAKK